MDASGSSGPVHGNGSLQQPHGAVVQVKDLVKKFGNFTAVNHVSFEVHRSDPLAMKRRLGSLRLGSANLLVNRPWPSVRFVSRNR